MSYSIHLRPGPACPTCGQYAPQPECCPDPTYNLARIFDLALRGQQVVLGSTDLAILDGRTALETTTEITAAVERLNDPLWKERFIAFESPNGWGDLRGAQIVMDQLLKLALKYPHNIWEIE